MMNLGTDPKWARHLRRWEKAVRNKGFWPEKLDFSHLFPALPTISHLFPLKFFLPWKPRWGSARQAFWRGRYALELDWGMG